MDTLKSPLLYQLAHLAKPLRVTGNEEQQQVGKSFPEQCMRCKRLRLLVLVCARRNPDASVAEQLLTKTPTIGGWTPQL